MTYPRISVVVPEPSKEPLYARVSHLRSCGLTTREISDQLDVSIRAVHSAALYAVRLETMMEIFRENCRKRNRASGTKRRREAGRPTKKDIKDRAIARGAPIVAAIDAGMSYSQAARQFGMTRNAVAGIVNRAKRL